MEVNLRTMPKDVVYQCGENTFIWKRDRFETRDGNYHSETPSTFTEVFRINGLGYPECVWSGRLTDNPSIYGENGLDSNNCFHIFSFDQDCGSRFQQSAPLTVAPQEIQDQIMEIEPKTRTK